MDDGPEPIKRPDWDDATLECEYAQTFSATWDAARWLLDSRCHCNCFPTGKAPHGSAYITPVKYDIPFPSVELGCTTGKPDGAH